jgi:hypothetical protein
VIQRLIGVYNANGTLRGEMAYLIGARLGRAHCSLCDITHGTLREKPEWRSCRAGLPVPFDTYHRNDQPDEVRIATGGAAPVVVAATANGIVGLVTPAELDGCSGSIDEMMVMIEAAVLRLGLAWP